MAAVLLMTACTDDRFVNSEVTGVTLTETAVMLQIGETATVGATIEPAGAKSDVVWSSSDTLIAKVNQFGGITAKGKGTASIIVTTKVGRKVASCAVYVDAIRVTRIELDKAALYMLPGDSATIKAKLFSADPAKAPTDTVVTWTSSDAKVATVSTTGGVKATGFGNATITATSEDGNFKATCLVTVSKISVTGLLLDKSAIEGTFGDEIQLTATILPDNATFPEIIWTSSDSTMVTVSATGLVKFVNKNAGTAVIRATSKDNNIFWKECTVTILKDMSGIVETIVWTGPYTITGWANPLTIAYAKFGNDLKAGDKIRFYFQSLGTNPELQIWYADWSGKIVDVKLAAGSEYYEMELTADIIQKMKKENQAWGDGGLLMQGDGNIVLSKVSVVTTVGPQLEPVADPSYVFFDFDSKGSWWGDCPQTVENDPAYSISGKYFHIKCTASSGWYGLFWRNAGNGLKVSGVTANNWVIKYDINVLGPDIKSFKIRLGDFWYITDVNANLKKWYTYTAPLSGFKNNNGNGTPITDADIAAMGTGGDFGFADGGSGGEYDVLIDNVRFEPK